MSGLKLERHMERICDSGGLEIIRLFSVSAKLKRVYENCLVFEDPAGLHLLSFGGEKLAFYPDLAFDTWLWIEKDSVVVNRSTNKKGLLSPEGRLAVPCQYDDLRESDDLEQIIATQHGWQFPLDSRGKPVGPVDRYEFVDSLVPGKWF